MTAISAARRRAAERALVELESLIVSQLGDSEAADQYRERFHDELRTVAAGDRVQLEELAGDLDSLSGREVPDGGDDSNAGVRLEAALRIPDWPEAMRILRSAPDAVPSWRAALIRGRGWSVLGYHQAAAAFLAHAIKLGVEPQSLVRVLWLEELVRAQRLDLAIPEAHSVLAQPDADPLVRLAALSVLHRESLSLAAGDRAARWEMLIRETRKALTPELVERPEARALVVRAHLVLAYAYEHLGRLDDARRALDDAVNLRPAELGARLARGLFRAALGDADAEKDLRLVVDAGATVPAPYAILALLALRRGQSRDSEALARRALDLALVPEQRTAIQAILESALGRSSSPLDPTAVVEPFRAAEADPLLAANAA